MFGPEEEAVEEINTLLGSPRPPRRKRKDDFASTTPKRHKEDNSTTAPARRQPAGVPSVEEDGEYGVKNSEAGDEEGELGPGFHVKATGLESEERANDLTSVRTEVDWYKVSLDNAARCICVDPSDGVKVWGKYGGPETCAYDNIAELMEKPALRTR
jgi:hypothetical protein